MQKNKGHDNLIPITDRTDAERREIASKGGRAKAENQRKKKEIGLIFSEILNRTDWVRDSGFDWDFAQKTKYYIDFDEETPLLVELCYRTVRQALNGNIKATAIVFEYLEKADS